MTLNNVYVPGTSNNVEVRFGETVETNLWGPMLTVKNADALKAMWSLRTKGYLACGTANKEWEKIRADFNADDVGTVKKVELVKVTPVMDTSLTKKTTAVKAKTRKTAKVPAKKAKKVPAKKAKLMDADAKIESMTRQIRTLKGTINALREEIALLRAPSYAPYSN